MSPPFEVWARPSRLRNLDPAAVDICALHGLPRPAARHLRLVFKISGSLHLRPRNSLERHPIHVLTYSPPGFWFEHRAQRRCGAPSRRKGIHICVYPRTTAHVTYANDVSALRAVASSALGIEWALRIACRRSLLLREGGGTPISLGLFVRSRSRFELRNPGTVDCIYDFTY